MLFATERDVVRVDDDQEVQKTGNDQEADAVLVGGGANVAFAEAERRGEKVQDTDAKLRARLERREQIGRIEREDASLEPQPYREHQWQRDQKDKAFPAPTEPEVPEAWYRPRGETQQYKSSGLRFLGSSGTRGAHQSVSLPSRLPTPRPRRAVLPRAHEPSATA